MNVRVLTYDERSDNAWTRALGDVLGSDLGARSWLKVCKGGCLSPTSRLGDGVHHSKLVVFTKIAATKGRTVTDLTYVGSANLSRSNSELSFNNTTVIPNDRRIAAAAISYMSKMTADRTDLATPSVTSGKYRLDFFPRPASTPDPALAWLRAVDCRVKAPGYGRDGRTVVRVLMYQWTNGRLAVAKKLVALRKAGCDVAVVVNDDPKIGTLSSRVASTLLRGGVPTWDGNHMEGGVRTHFMHAKTVTINGAMAGRPTKRVYSGSGNFTTGSFTRNDEVVLRTIDAAATLQTERWFDLITQHSVRRSAA